jgi:hypothetical protein
MSAASSISQWEHWRMNLNETAPQGARVSRADGTAVECDLSRNPKGDWRGGAAWMAVAREPMSLDYNSDRFECDVAPPGTVICFSVDLLPGSDGWPRGCEHVTKVTAESDFACPQGGTRLTWPVRPDADDFMDPWLPDDPNERPAAAALLAYWKAVTGDPVSRGALMNSKSRLWRLARDMAGAMERDALARLG